MSENGCTTCGMANCSGEFHPHALCLLVKARKGNTLAAREDMEFIIRAARTDEPATRKMVDRFLRNVNRELRR